MIERHVQARWGEVVHVSAVDDLEAVLMDLSGPRGGDKGYVVLDLDQARELASALHLALAEVDVERGRRAAGVQREASTTRGGA